MQPLVLLPEPHPRPTHAALQATPLRGICTGCPLPKRSSRLLPSTLLIGVRSEISVLRLVLWKPSQILPLVLKYLSAGSPSSLPPFSPYINTTHTILYQPAHVPLSPSRLWVLGRQRDCFASDAQQAARLYHRLAETTASDLSFLTLSFLSV